MRLVRSFMLQMFLLMLALAACAPGVIPSTAQGIPSNTAAGAAPTTARGVTQNASPGTTPNVTVKASPKAAQTVASVAPTKAVQTATPNTNTSSGAATIDTAAAAQALERYLGALTSKNESLYSQSICKDWETQAFLEFDAYQGLELVLRGLVCQSTGTGPGEAQGNCQGKILMNYGNERQEVDLSRRNYRLTFTGDQWLVCGFSE